MSGNNSPGFLSPSYTSIYNSGVSSSSYTTPGSTISSSGGYSYSSSTSTSTPQSLNRPRVKRIAQEHLDLASDGTLPLSYGSTIWIRVNVTYYSVRMNWKFVSMIDRDVSTILYLTHCTIPT